MACETNVIELAARSGEEVSGVVRAIILVCVPSHSPGRISQSGII